MKKILLVVAVVMVGAFVMSLQAFALPTQVIYLGDTIVEKVQTGYSGTTNENLADWFSRNQVTNMDGSAINPVVDQKQYELFFTDVARNYEVQYLGVGYAAYHSPFGVFTYTGDPYAAYDPTKITYYSPLFVQNEAAKNATFQFSITAGTYFGFYLNVNKTGKDVSTMIATNPDGIDHALFFDTNKGYTIAFEDIIGGGDKDYEDLVVNFKPADGTGFTSTPEPSTFLLFGAGLVGLIGFGRRQLKK